jgi:hypothetical protein
MSALRFLLAIMVGVAPVTASAIDVPMHAAQAALNSDQSWQQTVPTAHVTCPEKMSETPPSPDKKSDALGCAACCLAHNTIVLHVTPHVARVALRWSTIDLHERGAPINVPHPNYGLKRPPRA